MFSNSLVQALQQQVVGQQYSISALARAVTLATLGLVQRRRPLAVLLLLGQSGSGKNHVARSFARLALGDERGIIHIDCQRLTREGDPLADLHRQLIDECLRVTTVSTSTASTFSIILLDRIDEAPASLRDSLASEIERGEIVTSGSSFPLDNCFVLLTASLSKRKADQLIGRTIGFFREGEPGNELSDGHLVALEEMDQMFGIRLVSNIDEIIILDRPNEQNVIQLFERRLSEIEQLLARCSIGFMIDADAKTFLIRRVIEDLTHGLRQLNRILRNHLEFPIADLILSAQLTPGTTVVVKHEPPRGFLNFQILIPWLSAGEPALLRPQTLRAVSIG
ncbi:MAG TPA: hypothetical protein VKM94_23310 [Blastocatellia bacterium]|nr:hypothetical protein [Blastocatellia bacterium]